MKVTTIIGARPQFIKMATVSRALRKKAGVSEIIIHTGQHYDHNMSEVFFEEMEIPRPDYNLNINGLTQGAMTGQMLEAIEKVLLQTKPDMVIVYGDTNTTLAGALAAKKLHIKVAHVEAGLRSYNMAMPEEINRIVTDRISDILFCPTQNAVNILKREGYDYLDSEIILSGDVMMDAVLYYSQKAEQNSAILTRIPFDKYVLCTLHRDENTSNKETLVSLLAAIDGVHSQMPVVMPLHPRTQKMIKEYGIDTKAYIINPVGYFDMLMLLKNSVMVMTDSGGLQKEAFYFKKFCMTLRNETEWVELVDNGFNQLCGSNAERVNKSFNMFLNTKKDFGINLYGDGHAAEIIAGSLLSLA